MAVSPLLLQDFVESERDRITETLFSWLRIPSISAQPDHAGDVRASAEFTADLLREAGLENVGLIETHGPPAVNGDWLPAGADAPTILVYGHHDVQPVDPLDQWISPPFVPVIVEGGCRARGAVDERARRSTRPRRPGVCCSEMAACPSTSSSSWRVRRRSVAPTSSRSSRPSGT